jgi:hypothetical protein
MPVVMTMEIPASRAALEAISAAIGAQNDPPDGLIIHAITESEDGIRVVDIWESPEHYARFVAERLTPATDKVMEAHHFLMPAPPPHPVFAEAFDLVRGR